MPKRYINETLFDPATCDTLRAAFEHAWALAQEEHMSRPSMFEAEWVREVLALRIIAIAQQGERDPERLSRDALDHLAQTAGHGRDAGARSNPSAVSDANRTVH